MATLAAEATLLHTAEGRCRVGDQRAVQATMPDSRRSLNRSPRCRSPL